MFKYWGTGDLVRDEEIFDGTTEYNQVEAFVGDDSPNHIDLNRVIRNLWENEEYLYEYLTSIANVQEVRRGIYKNSIAGNELRLDSGTDVVALDFVSSYETYELTAEPNPANALGGTYFEFYSVDNDHYYVWYNSNGGSFDPGQAHTEITEVTTNFSVDITEVDGNYFLIHSPTAQYYVWYNLDGLSSDPAPGGIGIPVAVVTGDTENIVASKTAVQINNNAAFAANSSSNVVTITNAVAGDATDATLGTLPNFSINVTQQGLDQVISADLGAEINISSGDTAEEVKNATIVGINGVFSKLSASDLGGADFRITSEIIGGITTNITPGTTGFTINSIIDGSTSYKYFARVAPGIVYFNNEIYVSIPQTTIAERQLERIFNLRTWLPIPERVEINYSTEYDNYQARIQIYDQSNVLQSFTFTGGGTWGMPSTGGYNTGIEVLHAIYKSSQFHKVIVDNVGHDLLKLVLEPTSEILQTASGLVIYYPFRGGSGEDLAGTYNGTLSEARASVGIADAIFDGGYGVAIDGVNDYIETLSFEEIPDGAFTMSIWGKANAFDSSDQNTLFASWNDANSTGIYVGTKDANPSQFIVKVDNGTGSPAEIEVNNPFTVGDPDWTLIVVNFEPEKRLELFVNNEFVESVIQDGSAVVAGTFGDIGTVVPSPEDGDYVFVTNESAHYRYFEEQGQWLIVATTETGVDIPQTIKEEFLIAAEGLFIGRRGDSSTNYVWNGDVDEFTVFDRVITAARRKDLWDLRNPVDTNYLEVSYPLDDGFPSNNLVDRSGKNRDVANNGTALIRGIRNEFNEEGNAAYFDSNGDGISLPPAAFDLNEGTFSMWFYLDDFTNINNLFTSSNNPPSNDEWSMYYDGTDLYWRVGNGTTTYDALVGEPEEHKWHNMIVTWLYDSGADETTLTGYLDNQMGGSVVLDGNISSAANISIGNYWDISGGVFSNNEISGKLAYTTVYDIVLDSQQIEDLYNLRFRNTLGTVSHFNMDFTLADFSANPGTLYDATNYDNDGIISFGGVSDPKGRARPAIGPDETILTAASNQSFSCAEFNSTTGYIDRTSNTSNIFNQASGSFSAWVWFDDLTDGANVQPAFFSGRSGTANGNFFGATAGSNLQWTFGNGSASQTVEITPTITENAWHHVVITWEFVGGTQTEVETYFDNVAGGTATISGQIFSPSAYIAFGRYETEYMDGRMQEVVIYDTVLTSDDVDSLYRLRKPRNISDVTLWYSMNDGIGSTVTDYSNNGYNGIFSNPSWLPGIGGNALDFDGGLQDSLNFNNPIERKVRFSLAFWMFPDSPSTNSIVFEADSTFNMKLEKTSTAEQYGFYSTGDTPVQDATHFFTVSNLTWTHITIVGDGTDVTLYKDGVSALTMPQTGFFAPGELYFGSDPAATIGLQYKGMLSDIVFYDYVISAQEISDLIAFNNPSIGLVANYQYDISGSTFNDESVNGNNGTADAGIEPVAGFGGRAAEFDGIDDYFNIPVAAFNQDAGSYSAWVYFDDVLTQQPMFFTSTDNINGSDYEFRGNLNGGNLEWIIPNGTTTTPISFGPITERTWYHVVITWEYDGSTDTTVQAFLDATLINTETVTGQIPDAMDNISVGVYRNSFMKGAVDQLAVYSRVLSQSEITEINKAKRSNLNPVVHYDMEENTGTTLNDDSGSANNGVLQGASWTVGVSGSAVEFDGFNDYFETTNTVDGTSVFSGGEISVAFWIRRRDDYKTRSIPFTYGLDATDGFYFELGQAAASGKFVLNNAGNAYDIATGITVDDTDWTHIALTYTTTGNQWIVYVNGTQYLTGSLAGTMVFPNRKIYIGSYYDGTHQYHFDGLIDEVAFFDKVLASTEVTDLYNFRTTSPSGIPTNIYLGFNSDFELDNSGIPFNNGNGFDLYTFSYTTATSSITISNLQDLREFYQRSNDFKTQTFYNVPADISSLDAGTELYQSMDYTKVDNQDVEWIVLRQDTGTEDNAVFAWDESEESFTFNKDIIVEGQSFANIAASVVSAVPSAATFADISSVVPSPVDGNLCFVRDENQFYRYLGQSGLWIPVSAYISQFKTATVTLLGNQNVSGNDLRFEFSGIQWRISGSNLMVLVNGVVQLHTLDYNIIDNSTIEFLSGTLGADFEDDDRISVMVSTGGEEVVAETVTYYAGTAKAPYTGASNYIYPVDFPVLIGERMRVHRDGLLQQASELRTTSESTSNGTNTTIIDVNLPTLDSTWVDNFVLGITGANQGVARQIQSVSEVTKTITLKSAMPSVSQTGDQYQIFTDYDFLANTVTNEIIFSDQLTINPGARVAIEQAVSVISNADINLAGTSFPTGVPLGTEFYRTDLGSWFKYNGTAWIQI